MNYSDPLAILYHVMSIEQATLAGWSRVYHAHIHIELNHENRSTLTHVRFVYTSLSEEQDSVDGIPILALYYNNKFTFFSTCAL